MVFATEAGGSVRIFDGNHPYVVRCERGPPGPAPGVSEPANQLHRDSGRDPLARVMRRHEEHVRPRGIIRGCADLYRQNRTPFIGGTDGIDVDNGIRSRPCIQGRANSVGRIVE